MELFRSIKNYRMWAVALMAVFFLGTSEAAQASCATPEEMVALNSSVLVSDLMVAALSCGQQKQYNRFVNKFSRTLVTNNKNLKHYFERYYDNRAEFELNRFITRMANLSSQSSLKQSHEEYCSASNKLFKSSMALPTPWQGKKKALYAHADVHGIKPCGKKFSFGDLFSKSTYSVTE